jgi:hypothetical protein
MKKKALLIILIVSTIALTGCSLVQNLIFNLLGSSKSSKKEKSTVAFPSPYSQPEVFCTYFQYFRSDTYAQWWYPGKEPSRILGPEPWRRDIWVGRAGDYPYLGIYNNVTDGEMVRWQIRLAQASGISAFLLFVYDWQRDLPQTTLLLDIAAQEGFKIGFIEHHSLLGAVSRRILDGRPQPILPREYEGYDRIMEQYFEKMGLPQPAEQTRYIKPVSRSLRNVPANALDQASGRISGMLNQWKSHPAYLRIDGKPIILIPYMDANLTAAEFKTLTDKIRSNVGEDLYIVAIVPQVYWYFYPPAVTSSGITQDWANSGANAFTHWTPNGMVTATQKTRLKATEFNVKDSIKWKKDPIIPIMAGFDDDAWNPGGTPPSPRNTGQAWTDQLDAALTAKPRFLFIQAWNEWHEGSQIEPSMFDSDPYLYVKILAQKLQRPWHTPPLPPPNSVDSLRSPYLPY